MRRALLVGVAAVVALTLLLATQLPGGGAPPAPAPVPRPAGAADRRTPRSGPVPAVPLVVVSAASYLYFDRLRNLVGSVHRHEGWQNTPVVVYDIGLSPAQVAEAQSWCAVRVVAPAAWREWPEHVRELQTYAWKPLIIADALREHRWVLWQDAGQELRAPLDVVRELLYRHGHVLFTNPPWDLCALTHSATLEALGEPADAWCHLPQCGGSTVGIDREAAFAHDVVGPWTACALDQTCIAPSGATVRNHRFDQSVLSVLAHKHGYLCNPDPSFWLDAQQLPSGDEGDDLLYRLRAADGLRLFSRKAIKTKPFAEAVEVCNV